MTRKRLLSVLGVLLAAALAAWMVWRIDDKAALIQSFRDALGHPGWLALGIALLGVSLFAGAIRWWILLRVLETPLPFRETLRLYLAGHFCSIFATGSTGGDVVKASIVVARFPGRRLDALSSILIERLIGFASIVFPLWFGMLFLIGSEVNGMNRLFAIAGFLTAVFFVFGILWVLTFLPDWPTIIGRRNFYQRNPRWQKMLNPVFHIWRNTRDFLFCRHRCNQVFDLSVLNHVVAALCGVALVRATGADVPFLPAAMTMLLANIVAIVPLTPGGVGLREATVMGLLCLVGATEAQAAAAGFLVFGVTLVWAAVGAIAWFALKKTSARFSESERT